MTHYVVLYTEDRAARNDRPYLYCDRLSGESVEAIHEEFKELAGLGYVAFVICREMALYGPTEDLQDRRWAIAALYGCSPEARKRKVGHVYSRRLLLPEVNQPSLPSSDDAYDAVHAMCNPLYKRRQQE